MTLREFFLLGMRNNLFRKRAWVNMLFNIVLESKPDPQIPYLAIVENEEMYFIDPNTKDKVFISDYIHGRAPLHFLDEFILQPGEIANYKEDKPLTTTYGNVFVNWLTLVDVVGDRIPFQAGIFPAAKLGTYILENAIDDRMDGDETEFAPEGQFYIWQYKKFGEHCLALNGYSAGLVTSTTRASLQGNDSWFAIRDQWIKDNKHRLHDPAAVAELNVIADKMDDEYLKNDASFKYYKSKKKLAGCRRKLHYLFGAESPFSDGTTVELIAKSLEEGLDMDHLVVMNNSLRFGSYNRGAQTALGGESTKTIYRMVGTIRVAEQDCGTWLGAPILVSKDNAETLIGFTHIKDNQHYLITKDDYKDYIGQTLLVRGPMTCKTGRNPNTNELGKGRNICAVCAGQALAENANAIPAATAGVGGTLMSIFMAKMHSSTLRTVKWDMDVRLT